MPYDPILGVGHELQPQPAVVSFNETRNSNPLGQAESFNMDIPENMQLMFLQATLTINMTIGTGAGTTAPLIILFRNGLEIDRLQWNIAIDAIFTATGQRNLYTFSSQRPDLFYAGDRISILFQATGAAEAADLIATMGAFGQWV